MFVYVSIVCFQKPYIVDFFNYNCFDPQKVSGLRIDPDDYKLYIAVLQGSIANQSGSRAEKNLYFANEVGTNFWT